MYQPPRTAPRAAASSASSPRTNPLRSNNERDSMSDRTGGGDGGSGYPDQESTPQDDAKQLKNLNHIIQQFFVKGALTLVGSRISLPPAKSRDGDDIKYNKWFNLVLPESDALSEYTVEWKNLDISHERPSPMVIEIYLDLAELTRNQKLILLDEDGKRWDVAEALNPSPASSARPTSRTGPQSQVVLERWEISLDDWPTNSARNLGNLSSVYKRGIPLFRSLYTYGRTMPAYRYSRRVAKQPSNQPTVKLNYRILNGNFKGPRRDTLGIPLALSEDEVMERFSFDPLECSAGTLNISVSYRSNCDFRVDDTESLMSSHFMASDDYFRPSLAARQKDAMSVPSSVPNTRHEYTPGSRDAAQVYGSLSTFHKAGGAPGTSPLSAIRAIRDDGGASPDTPPQRTVPDHRRSTSSRSSLRSETAPTNARRPSVSFQPFKAGSLTSSPAMNVPMSPGTSLPRNSGPSSLTHTRNRPSLTTLPQQVLRTPNLTNETAIASSASSSPKPAPIARYSSSFSHRKTRLNSAGSKGDDDQNSSGKQSASSSAQPGSDLITESRSGSAEQTEDDKNLQEFIHLLEAKKDLKSFTKTDSAARDATMRRTTAALSKYRGMRESNTVLSDSMSSSLLLHRSSSSSSRQLQNLPAMIHGTSVSTSSSPGKPISPHTPHTPAIPSRLSDNLTIDYPEPRRSRSSRRRPSTSPMREDNSSEDTAHDAGTNAIDIPTSPRPWPYVRRSSSASQQRRTLDNEPGVYGVRSSTSLPAEDRPDLSMSELLRVNIESQAQAVASPDERSPEPETADYQAYPFPSLDSRPDSREDSSNSRPSSVEPAHHLRQRFPRSYRRGSPSFSSERGSRYSAGSRLSAHGVEDEDLIFHLSELGSGSRRSIEEPRGASGSGRGERRGGQ